MSKHFDVKAMIARKDRLELARDYRMLLLIIVTVLLSIASILSNYERLNRYELDRITATQMERESWLSQGDRDPHSAAHFAQWTFRPLMPTEILDTFAVDYAGRAIWLEAHSRNPATNRPIEDRTSAFDVGQLSVGWIFQVLGSAFAFLLGSGIVAKERQRGTLNLMIASGANLEEILYGKIKGLLFSILAVAVPILLVGLTAVIFASTDMTSDLLIRTVLWIFLHILWLIACVILAISISSLSSTSARSLMVLLCIWAVTVPVAPRFLSDLSEHLFPTPTATQFWEKIYSDINDGVNDSGNKKEREIALEKELFSRYSVTSRQDLPISFRGALLDANERFGNSVLEKHYATLNDIYKKQQVFTRLGGLFTPLISLQNVSAALAGTDNQHLNYFYRQAEKERQRVVNALNENLMVNAASDSNYTADEKLWSSFEVFKPQQMTVERALGSVVYDIAILMLWFCLILLVLFKAKKRLSDEFSK